jgi:hypothetical protein
MTKPQKFQQSVDDLREQVYLKSGLYRKPMGIGAVKAILQGIDNLEDYLFPPEEKEEPKP